jgi:hypothetical protein
MIIKSCGLTSLNLSPYIPSTFFLLPRFPGLSRLRESEDPVSFVAFPSANNMQARSVLGHLNL